MPRKNNDWTEILWPQDATHKYFKGGVFMLHTLSSCKISLLCIWTVALRQIVRGLSVQGRGDSHEVILNHYSVDFNRRDSYCWIPGKVFRLGQVRITMGMGSRKTIMLTAWPAFDGQLCNQTTAHCFGYEINDMPSRPWCEVPNSLNYWIWLWWCRFTLSVLCVQ